MKKFRLKICSFYEDNFFFELSLFLLVIFTLILPSLSNSKSITLHMRPKDLFSSYAFFVKVLIFAMFEELIYRVYLPFQMKSLYNFFVKLKKNRLETIAFSLISNVFFASAHFYLGIFSVAFAFIAGLVFTLIYECIGKRFNAYLAFFAISLIHFLYNSIVFYILIYCTCLKTFVGF